jgi:hypothetical protein
MNVDDPKLTAYALDELDELERSAVARSAGESPELQRFVAETQEFARALRSEYALELERGLETRKALASIQGEGFWSTSGPLAIAAVIAVLAVVGAVTLSNNHLQTAAVSRSNLPEHLVEERSQPNQFAAVEGEDAARSPSENFGADAGPYAFTGERPFVSVISRPRSSVPLTLNSVSYVDVRRSIDAGSLPPRNAVRIEELINHFTYDYPPPPAGESFSLNVDVVTCPWKPTHWLVRIGAKGNQSVGVGADSTIEVEFNPRTVGSYRLIGYDRQETETQNSNEQKVGSHSLEAGYTLTTLYEIVPLKRVRTLPDTQTIAASGAVSGPLLTATLQIHQRGNDAARALVQRTVTDTGFAFTSASADLKFAAAVAEFGMILRDSEFKGNGSLQEVIEWAQQGMGADVNGYRADFIQLVRKTEALKKG